MDSNSYSLYQNSVDSSGWTNSSNELLPPVAPSYNHSNETMPPVAPSYKHLLWTAEGNNYPVHYSEQQTLDRLMDSVYKSRMEGGSVRQPAFEICVEDVRIENGAIEFRARIIPEPANHLDNDNNSGYPHPAPSYKHPVYQYPYQSSSPHGYGQYPYQPSNQFGYQQPYQSAYQSPYQSLSEFPNQVVYQPSYQSPYQAAYPSHYQLPYTYLNQGVPSQYLPQPAYRYQYPNQFPAQYLYQYPPTNVVSSIANAISQLAFTSYLLRR